MEMSQSGDAVLLIFAVVMFEIGQALCHLLQ